MIPSIQKAKLAVDAAEANLSEIVRLLQKRCKHENLIEAEYQPDNYGGFSFPPLRMCADCGMTEDGWGHGYVVLKGLAQAVSRDRIYEQRIGLRIHSHYKGPLLRKEITVDELIDKETP